MNKISEFISKVTKSSNFIYRIKFVLLLLIIILLIIDFSLTSKFLKGSHTYIDNSNNDITNINISYDKLISGNLSGNLNMYYQDYNTAYKKCTGGFASKDGNIYSIQAKGNTYYLMKSSTDKPTEFVPIFDSYYISFLNIVDSAYLYFVAHPIHPETPDDDLDQIYCMTIDGTNLNVFSVLETHSITSMVTNNNNVFFTEKFKPYIYCTDLNGTQKTEYIKLDNNNYTPYIFGIDSSCLYYVTGSCAVKYNYIDKTSTILSKSLTSPMQNIILADKSIIGYSDLTCSELVMVDIETQQERKIITNQAIKDTIGADKIDRFNYSSGFLFFAINNNIYYTNIYSDNPKLNLLKEAKISNPIFFLNNEYFFYSDTEYGEITAININYILSQ